MSMNDLLGITFSFLCQVFPARPRVFFDSCDPMFLMFPMLCVLYISRAFRWFFRYLLRAFHVVAPGT
jgi:hypothetical protein